jgi:hypothetical protein
VNNTNAAPMSGAELRRRRLAVQRELAENESAWQRELDREVEEKANTPINWSVRERLAFRSQEYDDDGTNCVTRNVLHFGDCERQEFEEQVAALEGRVEQLKLDHEKHVKAAKRKSNNDRKRLERIVSGELLTSADLTKKTRDKKSLKSRAYADKQTAKANQTLARLMQIQTVMLASALGLDSNDLNIEIMTADGPILMPFVTDDFPEEMIEEYGEEPLRVTSQLILSQEEKEAATRRIDKVVGVQDKCMISGNQLHELFMVLPETKGPLHTYTHTHTHTLSLSLSHTHTRRYATHLPPLVYRCRDQQPSL